MLAFASEDAQRFYPEMGTVFLKRIGEMVSTALMRHFDADQTKARREIDGTDPFIAKCGVSPEHKG